MPQAIIKIINVKCSFVNLESFVLLFEYFNNVIKKIIQPTLKKIPLYTLVKELLTYPIRLMLYDTTTDVKTKKM